MLFGLLACATLASSLVKENQLSESSTNTISNRNLGMDWTTTPTQKILLAMNLNTLVSAYAVEDSMTKMTPILWKYGRIEVSCQKIIRSSQGAFNWTSWWRIMLAIILMCSKRSQRNISTQGTTDDVNLSYDYFNRNWQGKTYYHFSWNTDFLAHLSWELALTHWVPYL